MITASELARTLGISRQRVRQYVQAGKLDGCFSGDGSLRRFDLAKSAEALGKRLDPGQLMGNGAATKAVLNKIQTKDSLPAKPLTEPKLNSEQGSEPTSVPDPESYESWRTEKAKEETRRLRRQNAEAEGHYVLASAVAQATAKLISREISEFQMALDRGARIAADKLGVDYRTLRMIMRDSLRDHRTDRAVDLHVEAENSTMSEMEQAEDI